MSKWMSRMTKSFGSSAVDLALDHSKTVQIGSPSFNWCVGNGGIVEGKTLCLFGPESGGKSLLMQLLIISIQKKYPDGIFVLFDAEFSFNKEWFVKLGGDPERLYVRQSNNPTEIFDYIWGEMLEMLQDGAPIKGIAIDSVKSILYPKDQKKISTALTMGGGGASYLGPALKGILPVIKEHNLTTLLVQQVYEELDPMKALANPFKVPDGRALKHFCDYMLQVERFDSKSKSLFGETKDLTGNRNIQVGHTVRVKAKKNRCGAPYRVAEFQLSYEEGIVNTVNELIELAKTLNVIYHPLKNGKPSNAYWEIDGYEAIHGQPKLEEFISSDVALQDLLVERCNSVEDDVSAARNKVLAPGEVEINLEDL